MRPGTTMHHPRAFLIIMNGVPFAMTYTNNDTTRQDAVTLQSSCNPTQDGTRRVLRAIDCALATCPTELGDLTNWAINC